MSHSVSNIQSFSLTAKGGLFEVGLFKTKSVTQAISQPLASSELPSVLRVAMPLSAFNGTFQQTMEAKTLPISTAKTGKDMTCFQQRQSFV